MLDVILYIGNFRFPLWSAAGKRVYMNGKALREAGYECVFVGAKPLGETQGGLEASESTADGFVYYHFSTMSKNPLKVRTRAAFTELTELLIRKKYLDRIVCVITYGSPNTALFNWLLMRFFKKRRIPVVADCADWHVTKTSNPLFDLVKTIDTYCRVGVLNKHVSGVIAISRWLERYYRNSGVPTVLVPPLCDEDPDEIRRLYVPCRPTTLMYAGFPFREAMRVTSPNMMKDRLDVALTLLHQASRRGSDFIFNIYGITKSEYLDSLPWQAGILDELVDKVNFWGFATNDKVRQQTIQSDYMILLRDSNRMTEAGFSTKVAESLSCGTPVVTTRTSDLGEYVEEGETGYFIDIVCEEAAVTRLASILDNTADERRRQHEVCVERRLFYYATYAQTLACFLAKVVQQGVN